METMEVLMNQMNMMYHWEKVKLGFMEQESIGLEDVEKLLMRCLKLYKMIDQFINIFKLIDKKEVSTFWFADPILDSRKTSQGQRSQTIVRGTKHSRKAESSTQHPKERQPIFTIKLPV